jgi:hypothetical protein
MKRSSTSLKLTVAALGVIALFGAAAAAGVSRGEEMRATGVVAVEKTAAGGSGYVSSLQQL